MGYINIIGEGIEYNGRVFAELMLGSRGGGNNDFIPNFNQALIASILTQPLGFPDYPTTGISFILSAVRDYFSTVEAPKVKIFATVGKPLDYHGIDCFFYHRGMIATVDLTIKNGKNRPKADLILTDQIASGSEEGIYYFAEQVADLLVSESRRQLPIETSLFINRKYPIGYYVN